MSKELLARGINGATGRYSPGPESDSDLARQAGGHPSLSPGELRERRWWVERYGVDDPSRAPAREVDPLKLDEAGWGVLFSPEATPEIREALAPLLSRRKEQAGPYYRELLYSPGQSKLDFLVAHRAAPGPADPSRVPYYLLLVGSPETIPFRFQHDLDIQYAVGRIWFECPEEFARYAESVVQAEKRPTGRPKRLVFVAPENPCDLATSSISRHWITPLARRLGQEENAGWEVSQRLGPKATKEQLRRLLGGGETPSLLFLASHGLRFPEGHPLQPFRQGALLCQDWPGPREWSGEIPGEFYFAAGDVPEDESLLGLIAFLFADFGGGTTETPSEASLGLLDGDDIPQPSVARLPQRLLSHPRGGALAVVSLVDRSWGMSFGRTSESRVQISEIVLRRLLEGFSLGSAMELVNQRSAELSVELASLWDDRTFRHELGRERFAELWRAAQDTSNLMVFGDPAVRLA